MSVVSDVGDASAALRALDENEIDVVILDISIPGKSGLEILAEIKTKRPDLPVLILSIHPEESFGLRALRGGAAGYLTKQGSTDELIRAIRTVHSGRTYLSPVLADKVTSQLQSKTGGPFHEALSDREFQILRLIGSGKTVNEIAEELYLSANTVNTYRRRILEKMGMNTTVELIHYAVENGLSR